MSLQTKRLKFLEIALRCAAPNLHAAIRRIYDYLGPPLASVCRRTPWFADFTYLSLLPLEVAVMVLQLALRAPSHQIRRMYPVQRANQD